MRCYVLTQQSFVLMACFPFHMGKLRPPEFGNFYKGKRSVKRQLGQLSDFLTLNSELLSYFL